MKKKTPSEYNGCLRDMTPGTTFYVGDSPQWLAVSFFVEFIAIERGLVKCKVLDIYRDIDHARPDRKVGQIISVRPTSCYLSKKEGGCLWFIDLDSEIN